MANILICGDSWGCGEWNTECTQVTHTGLEQYLRDDDHEVYNISKGGCSNLDSSTRLDLWFEKFGRPHIDQILVFQTDYARDHKHHTNPQDWHAKYLPDLAAQWVERFYHRLSELAQKYHTPVWIIGGMSDTVWFDQMNLDYPGCEIACQSLVNLILNNDHRVDNPVYSWYSADGEPLLHEAKRLDFDLACTIDLINQGFERESLLRENPQFFYPDGKHPNRHAHGLLYQFLKQKSIIPAQIL